ncbi:hypothetical protein B0H12DRAFT_1070106 [Mycena haematopus]|nr:hypothetical protein B0H12DRAFT_1070106 [Mycena haematopus]
MGLCPLGGARRLAFSLFLASCAAGQLRASPQFRYVWPLMTDKGVGNLTNVLPQCEAACDAYDVMSSDCNAVGIFDITYIYCECTPRNFGIIEECFDCQSVNATQEALMQGLLDDIVNTCNEKITAPDSTVSISAQKIVPRPSSTPNNAGPRWGGLRALLGWLRCLNAPNAPVRSRGPSPKRPAALSGSASFDPSGAIDPADTHPVLQAGRVAVITGAASGIGAAAARAFARLGMKIALADLPKKLPELEALAAELGPLFPPASAVSAPAASAPNPNESTEPGKETSGHDTTHNILIVPTDVSRLADVQHLRERVYDAWSEVGVLMNNAGIGGLDGVTGTSWDGLDAWHAVFDVNLFGVVNVQQVFVPSCLSLIHSSRDDISLPRPSVPEFVGVSAGVRDSDLGKREGFGVSAGDRESRIRIRARGSGEKRFGFEEEREASVFRRGFGNRAFGFGQEVRARRGSALRKRERLRCFGGGSGIALSVLVSVLVSALQVGYFGASGFCFGRPGASNASDCEFWSRVLPGVGVGGIAAAAAVGGKASGPVLLSFLFEVSNARFLRDSLSFFLLMRCGAAMLHQENPAMILNTGSKQGITNPPGNTAYNASKAAVKSLTEGLAHALRERNGASHGGGVTAHLVVPGYTFTGLTGANAPGAVKPAGAWTADETVGYILAQVAKGVFYVLCPDGETGVEIDQLRIMWAAADVAQGRPALSRWHRDYKALFEEYMREGQALAASEGALGV